MPSVYFTGCSLPSECDNECGGAAREIAVIKRCTDSQLSLLTGVKQLSSLFCQLSVIVVAGGDGGGGGDCALP